MLFLILISFFLVFSTAEENVPGLKKFVIPVPNLRLLNSHIIEIVAEISENPTSKIIIGIQDTPNITEDSNIVFQMTIDFQNRQIYRNSYKNNNWGELEESGPFPFLPGKSLNLLIEVKHSTFITTVNGTRIFDFNTQIPIRLGKYIIIEGQLILQDISVSFPNDCKSSIPEGFYPELFGETSDGLKSGDNVKIHARFLNNPEFIEISFPNNERGTMRIFLLLINVARREVYAKRYQDVAWTNYRDYEQKSGFPFDVRKDFIIEFYFEGNRLNVSVDGNHFQEYKIYLPMEDVRYVHIGGSAETYSVELTDAQNITKKLTYKNRLDAHCSIQKDDQMNYILPYITPIPGDFFGHKKKMTIHGTIGLNMNYIEIGLLSDIWGTEKTILFHITDRTLEANYFQGNEWWPYDDEDLNDEFAANKTFVFEIERISRKYHVIINDKLQFEYEYRFESELARYLEIKGEGDFGIKLIEFENTVNVGIN